MPLARAPALRWTVGSGQLEHCQTRQLSIAQHSMLQHSKFGSGSAEHSSTAASLNQGDDFLLSCAK